MAAGLIQELLQNLVRAMAQTETCPSLNTTETKTSPRPRRKPLRSGPCHVTCGGMDQLTKRTSANHLEISSTCNKKAYSFNICYQVFHLLFIIVRYTIEINGLGLKLFMNISGHISITANASLFYANALSLVPEIKCYIYSSFIKTELI